MNSPVIIALVAIAIVAGVVFYSLNSIESNGEPTNNVEYIEPQTRTDPNSVSTGKLEESITDSGLTKFATFSAYTEFLDGFEEYDQYFKYPQPFMLRQQFAAPEGAMLANDSVSASAPAHSTTNVQVQGVDEADFVKNDSRYIYALKHNVLSIIDTKELGKSPSVSITELDIPKLVQKYDMFVNGDRLVVLYYIADYNQAGFIDDYTTYALVLDISDKTDVKRLFEHSITGKLDTARMIGDNVYVISSKFPDPQYPVEPILYLDDQILHHTPIYRTETIEQPNLTTVMAFEIGGGSANSISIVTDQSGSVFMSRQNLYISSTTDNDDSAISLELAIKILEPILDLYPAEARARIDASIAEINPSSKDAAQTAIDIIDDAFGSLDPSARRGAIAGQTIELLDSIRKVIESGEITSIHKITINGADFEISASGTIPGTLLNQFSMDEHDDKLRVATTVNKWADSANNVFVLDENLDALGALVGVAPNEEIYSARFVENKLYLVTFRQVDPFFVIDLSTDSPTILGKLKLPGYSDYLHFYDENTIIGIGRDEGVKIAVFDISNVARPSLTDSVIIGSWGTSSPVEQDHKAVLIDYSKSLLVLPVFSYETFGIARNGNLLSTEIPAPDEGNLLAFMVFDVQPSGLKLENTISHVSDYNFERFYARSLYIGDDLYAVSENTVSKSPLEGTQYTLDVPIGKTN